MKINRSEESPARRLGILYVTSFCLIALLLASSQAYVLTELSWQTSAMSAIGRFTRQRSVDRPLSLSALALLVADEPKARGELKDSLRNAIMLSQRESSGLPHPGTGRDASNGPESSTSGLLGQAAAHRLAATESADALLSLVERQGSAAPRFAESGPLLRSIITEEEAFGQAIGEAARATEEASAVHFKRLESFEFQLFALMLIVLTIEGLFVVNPAIKRIQRFMEDMKRSHDGLKIYAKKLERSNTELQDFASVASHDLQEPLRKVQAFSDRLTSRCAASIDDQGRDYLDRIQNAARRMQSLINDLLTYARIATKAQPFVPTNLVSITQEVVSDLEARIEQANGRVEVGELPTVDADPMQVRQLMQNLIGNSLKYQRRDVPPVVKVSSKKVMIDPAAPAGVFAGPLCQIMVEDNGIGFDEIYTEKIFTIFQRLHGRSEYEGTGVGLAVCRKIVERHGGTITARSTPGQGSTFMVTLPVQQPKEMTTDGLEN